jgi:hypothetical protein
MSFSWPNSDLTFNFKPLSRVKLRKVGSNRHVNNHRYLNKYSCWTAQLTKNSKKSFACLDRVHDKTRQVVHLHLVISYIFWLWKKTAQRMRREAKQVAKQKGCVWILKFNGHALISTILRLKDRPCDWKTRQILSSSIQASDVVFWPSIRDVM